MKNAYDLGNGHVGTFLLPRSDEDAMFYAIGDDLKTDIPPTKAQKLVIYTQYVVLV